MLLDSKGDVDPQSRWNNTLFNFSQGSYADSQKLRHIFLRITVIFSQPRDIMKENGERVIIHYKTS